MASVASSPPFAIQARDVTQRITQRHRRPGKARIRRCRPAARNCRRGRLLRHRIAANAVAIMARFNAEVANIERLQRLANRPQRFRVSHCHIHPNSSALCIDERLCRRLELISDRFAYRIFLIVTRQFVKVDLAVRIPARWPEADCQWVACGGKNIRPRANRRAENRRR